MRPNTKKGRIGKRRVHLRLEEIYREFGEYNLYRVPVYGNKLQSGRWYADVFYNVTDAALLNEPALACGYNRWVRPVFLHYVGMGTARTKDGRVVMLYLFDEMINDSGAFYKTKRWGNYYSLLGVDENRPLFELCKEEIAVVRKRASEKRHGWSK